jgi:GT2 family glycosyltransferase
VVPAYNAASTLHRCLTAVVQSERKPDEIIVFDDASTDSTAKIAARAGVRVIGGVTNQGPSHARNEAVKASRAQIIAFVDADVVIHPDALALLVAAIGSGEASAAFGTYDADPPARRISGIYGNLRHHWVHQQGKRQAGTFWGGLSVIERGLFLSHGGFDERIRCCEDVELGVRLARAGTSILLVKEAQGKHLKDWTLLQLWRSDILCRAIPWAKMIRERRGHVLDLNLSLGERAAAIAAHLVWLSLFATLLLPAVWPALLVSAALYLGWNARFFRFLFSAAGPLAGVGGVVLHWCYHIYASVTYLLVMMRLLERSTSAPLPQHDQSGQRW